MTMQQVNLYHPIFRREQKRFSAVTMAQAAGVLVLGVLLLYGYAQWRLYALRLDMAATTEAHARAAAQLTALAQELRGQGSDPRLQLEVAELERRIAASATLRAILGADSFDAADGYSRFFAALARQSVGGLWLTGVSVRGAGRALRLNGRSTQPELVPRYAERLAHETVLQGAQLQTLVMQRPKPRHPYIEFELRSAGIPAAEGLPQAQEAAPAAPEAEGVAR